MAGQSPVETISPLCSRWPESRADVSMLRKTVVDQVLPVTGHAPLVQVGTNQAKTVSGKNALSSFLHDESFSETISCVRCCNHSTRAAAVSFALLSQFRLPFW